MTKTSYILGVIIPSSISGVITSTFRSTRRSRLSAKQWLLKIQTVGEVVYTRFEKGKSVVQRRWVNFTTVSFKRLHRLHILLYVARTRRRYGVSELCRWFRNKLFSNILVAWSEVLLLFTSTCARQRLIIRERELIHHTRLKKNKTVSIIENHDFLIVIIPET